MKTYIAEWLILIVSILIVFSPFIYIGIKKWKWHQMVSWVQVLLAYILSIAIYYIWWIVISKIDRFIYNNHLLGKWAFDVIDFSAEAMVFSVILIWPFLVFYSTKLVKGRFTIWTFGLSLLFSLLMLAWLITGFFYIGMKIFFSTF